jgi:macrolide-specific efflux system membrane fusion protein
VGALRLVSVGAQVSGQIDILYVTLGQTVKKGDMIAQIDSTTQENTLAINQAKLESLKSQLESARISFKTAQNDYEREQQLMLSDATSRYTLESAEKTFAAARASVKEYESQVQQAQITVNNSEIDLGYTKITSPLDGTVVSIPVKEGQTVNANQTAPTIVQVADLTQMEILIQISEADVTKVAPGMPVRYTVLSEPGKTYETTLKSIDPGLTTLTNGSYTGVIDSNAAIYYYGRLQVPNDEGKLHIGMTTQNTIITQTAENVLIIPSVTVTGKGENATVHVLENGLPVEKAIQVGLSDNMNTEVLGGLSAGEQVISAGQLPEGSSSGRVRMRM